MRLALLGILAIALAGCVTANVVDCGNGIACPIGKACAAIASQPTCVDPDQVAACEGQAELAPCTAVVVPDGRCYGGVCLAAGCGNGRLDPGEACDDGNAVVGDGCSDACLSDETCGNGFLDPLRIEAGQSVANEACDDGNHASHDGCTSGCQSEVAIWAEQTPARITPRTSPRVVCDDVRRRLVAFGGGLSRRAGASGVQGVVGDTWESDGSTWLRIALDASPPPRDEHGLAYDGRRRQTILFGGFDGLPLNDTWSWDGVAWRQLHPAIAPPARFGHAMAYDGRRGVIVMFGGGTVVDGARSDTWEWDGATWREIVTPVAPDARMDPALAFDPERGVIVLAGGFVTDTWEYDGLAWRQVATDTTPVGLAAMTYEPAGHRLIGYNSGTTYSWDGTAWIDLGAGEPGLLGAPAIVTDADGAVSLVAGTRTTCVRGSCFRDDVDEVWRWSGTAWALAPSAATPGPRSDAAIAYDARRGRVVMIGGLDGTGAALDDAWELDGLDWNAQTDHPWSSGRWAASAAFDDARDELVVFGGLDFQSTTYQETWVEQDTGWIERTPATSPQARAGAAMAYDPSRREIVLFGGTGGSLAGVMNDTWRWDGVTWAQAAPAHVPPARARAALAFDHASGKLVLFGGEDTNALGDTWLWDGADWTEVVTDAPRPRSRATMAWDSSRARLVLVEGRSQLDELDDAWEWSGSSWQVVHLGTRPPARSGAMLAPALDGAGVYLFGGLGTVDGIVTTFGDAWRLRWEAPVAYEQCNLRVDDDGDGLAGCADPDCWATCSPLCPPGATCDPSTPRCGDGTCNTILETNRNCPEDCAPGTPVCGDTLCDPGETAILCPGDCTP